MASLTARSVLVHLDRAVWLKPLKLPVGGATAFVVVPSPVLAFFHDEVAEDLAVAVIDQCDLSAIRNWPARSKLLSALGRKLTNEPLS